MDLRHTTSSTSSRIRLAVRCAGLSLLCIVVAVLVERTVVGWVFAVAAVALAAIAVRLTTVAARATDPENGSNPD